MDEQQPARPTPSRRQVIKGAGVLAGVAALGGAAVVMSRSGAEPEPSMTMPRAGFAQPELDALAELATSGGPGKDGIPPIDQPRFVGPGEAGFLTDDEPVFGLDHGGERRAYPQLVLVWHEIVNDTIAGEPLSVTYCPLTGTVIAFRSPAGQALTFGTTGNLVNSNLLMYDRQTDSEWPQVLGTAISGRHKGQRLDTVALVWTTWGAWRETHPDTTVLSTDTGALRSYGKDPYGSYLDQTGYYVNENLLFRVEGVDDRFPTKDVVLGVRAGGEPLAIHKDLVRRRGSVDAEVGGTPVVARWDADLDTARVVHRDTGEPADFLDSMWFAWSVFYPTSPVLA